VAFWQLFEKLKAVGCELSEEGWVRLGKFAASLGFHRNVGLTPETLLLMLQRLHYELEVFAPGEITGTVPQPVVAPAQTPPQETEQQQRNRLDSDLETVSAETREGRRQCIAYLDGVWGVDVRNLYREFADFMDKTYEVDVMQDKVARYFGEWCDRWNKNPLNRKTYDEFRRALNKTGWFALSLLNRDEKLAQSIEHSQFDDLSVRQNFARRSREINSAQ
jgi:hypothetical protein